LADLKSTTPKVKGIVFKEQGKSTTTISSQQLQGKGQSQDKGKGKLVEPVNLAKKKDQIRLDEEADFCNYKLNLMKKKDLQERKLKKKKKPILPWLKHRMIYRQRLMLIIY
ncbi:hypothetical protein Tco_0431087, partial [Tanacetum coccineum]